ncbi:MAG: delta-60 repeat domain-containing protein [Pyrinomonadaceae bacterium]
MDATFNCATCDFNISNALPQSDGKIVVSGSTNFPSPGVVYRLNSDGSRDASFTSPFSVGNGNRFRVCQCDSTGRENFGHPKRFYRLVFPVDDLYRLNSDGTFDTTFTRISVGGGRLVRTIPRKISVLPDGKILVATNTTSASNSAG